MTDKQLAVLLSQIASRISEAAYGMRDALTLSNLDEIKVCHEKMGSIARQLVSQAMTLEKNA